MNKIVIIFLILQISILANPIIGKLSKDSVGIGEVFTLTIPLRNSLKDKEIKSVDQEWFKTVRRRSTKIENSKLVLELSVYSPPVCSIPSFEFLFGKNDSITDTLITESIIINVKSSITDTTNSEDVVVLRKPMRAGKSPIYYLIGGIILLLIIIFFVIKLIKKQLSKEKIIVLPQKIPAYEEAVISLDKLKAENLIDIGKYKEFTFKISEILRHYISRRYFVLIQEATSEEFIEWVKIKNFETEQTIILINFIHNCDMIKFAKYETTPDALDEFFDIVNNFCETTKPIGNDEVKGE